jgi:hypothetical protein
LILYLKLTLLLTVQEMLDYFPKIFCWFLFGQVVPLGKHE